MILVWENKKSMSSPIFFEIEVTWLKAALSMNFKNVMYSDKRDAPTSCIQVYWKLMAVLITVMMLQ